MASYKECMSHADECVRIAGLTDDLIVRDQIIGLAHGWMRAAGVLSCDDDARVIEFPWGARDQHLV